MESYISEPIKDFCDYLTAIREAYTQAVTDLEEAERETQDLLHFIELASCNATIRMQVYKKLKDTRRKRRNAKDTIEACQPIIEWIRNDKKTIQHLKGSDVLGKIIAIEDHQDRRIYGFRTHVLSDILVQSDISNKPLHIRKSDTDSNEEVNE